MSKDLEVMKPGDSAIAPMAVRDPESIIRFAIERNVDVATMEKLLVMRKQLKDEQAKEAYDSALAAFQAECPVIKKDKNVMERGGTTIRYAYAPLDRIVIQVKDLLQKHGFSYSVTTSSDATSLRAVCKVTHRDGHSELSEFTAPIDDKAFMNQQQKFAAAQTYAKRYAFCNALGILTSDDDTDAITDRPKPKGPSSIAPNKGTADDVANKKRLTDLLRDTVGLPTGYNLSDADRELMGQWLIDELIIGDEEILADLTGQRLADVVKKVEEKLK